MFEVSMTTVKEVRESFWELVRDTCPEMALEYNKAYREDKYSIDIRIWFSDYVRMLKRDGDISLKLAKRVTL